MTEFTLTEVTTAIEIAAGEVATRANYLDDPNVIGTNHGRKADEVRRLDRRAQALLYARDLVRNTWAK